jgi:hypothetical protein
VVVEERRGVQVREERLDEPLVGVDDGRAYEKRSFPRSKTLDKDAGPRCGSPRRLPGPASSRCR